MVPTAEPGQYLKSLLLSQPLREPLIRKIISSGRFPQDSRGLDMGCGPGLYTMILAETLGSSAHVTGLDTSSELLAQARFLANESGMKNRVLFQEGNAMSIPFEDKSFDWAFSMDCVGCIPEDPVILLNELRRVVRPGGLILILIWSFQLLLPGYPLLEAKLNATSAGIAPFSPTMKPERHTLCALEWFAQAGLQSARAETFVQDVSGPLIPEIKTALIDLFSMRWGNAKNEMNPEDWREYQRLCSLESPDLILDNPGYYGFFTYTAFQGVVPEFSPMMDR